MDLPIKHGGSFHRLCSSTLRLTGGPTFPWQVDQVDVPVLINFSEAMITSFFLTAAWLMWNIRETVCLMCFLARCHQPKWKKTWWFNVCSPAKMKNQMQTWWFFLCDWSSQHVDLPSKHVDFNQRTCDFTPARHGGFRMGLSVGKWLQEPFKTKTV